jgi:hypothetical protein
MRTGTYECWPPHSLWSVLVLVLIYSSSITFPFISTKTQTNILNLRKLHFPSLSGEPNALRDDKGVKSDFPLLDPSAGELIAWRGVTGVFMVLWLRADILAAVSCCQQQRASSLGYAYSTTRSGKVVTSKFAPSHSVTRTSVVGYIHLNLHDPRCFIESRSTALGMVVLFN